ncbi:MAG: 5-amino-6-(D-ribitylamino)uracil--L-tyrosine 4-hydroxyphenyl transferase CofH, partial [Porticoccaceae bacterium]
MNSQLKFNAEPRLDRAQLLALADDPLDQLMGRAAALRDQRRDDMLSFSRKIFLPLTHLCRNVCHYCTFAQPPRNLTSPYMTPEEILAVARRGAALGCQEALFTLGDKPELRYRVAREALDTLGYASTHDYLVAMAKRVFDDTGLLPHLNPGVMDAAELAACREVSVSQGLMLESVSERLHEKGGCHHGSPDKRPAVRLATLEAAGKLRIPFTSGILIGIGETRVERIDALLALRDLHDRHGHIQEVIIQNFCAKAGTLMANAPDAPLDELLWTIAMARIIFGSAMNLQTPPNLNEGMLAKLVGAGINDWGGVSPLTPDFVNPEKPWPSLENLAAQTAATGKLLVERLAVYPQYACNGAQWMTPAFTKVVMQRMDGEGYARRDNWCPGSAGEPPTAPQQEGWQAPLPPASPRFASIIARALRGERLAETEIVTLFQARGNAYSDVCRAADDLRREVNGDTVAYVVNRNINYTNLCTLSCKFCAFSKGKTSDALRGKPYILSMEEIAARAQQAWQRGATEVCLQGGIHPDYTGDTYLDICRTIRAALPDMHIHAFSPLEVTQGARTLGLPVADYLGRLKAAGLNSLPGTAAEILDDEVRAIICPDKINTAEWLEVVATAHRLGIRTTATIMFGHVDHPQHWARHLLRVRDVQAQTGGITEFVPLPFVHMEAPIYRRGGARQGPTFREAVLMHAVSRLVLHPLIPNIQVSWVKMGSLGIDACLHAGVNDLGGTLMNESISRAAGAIHGQEMTPDALAGLIRAASRTPIQRTTFYGVLDNPRSYVGPDDIASPAVGGQSEVGAVRLLI